MHWMLDNYMLRMTVGDPMREWHDALRKYLAEGDMVRFDDVYGRV